MNFVRLICALGLLCGLAITGSAAAEPGRITAVRVAPDLTSVELRLDGEVGPHSASVLDQPARLVIDFESAGLGKVPARIKVGRAPLDEVRVGKTDSRARVVMDFGQNPVPRFNVTRQNQIVLVSLGPGQAARNPLSSGSPANLTPRPTRPANPASHNSSSQKANSGLSAKLAGVTNDLIFVELTDRADPKRTYRLAIDFDYDGLQVKRATLSDAQGNVKRFDLVSAHGVPVMSSGSLSSSAGPRRDWANSAAQPERRPGFKWGAHTNEPAEPVQPRVISRGPLRMDEFTLQKRSYGQQPTQPAPQKSP